MKKIQPCIWFESGLADAMTYYGSVFPDFEQISIEEMNEGSAVVAYFRIFDETFMGLQAGPAEWKLNESISFMVVCDDQEEVDRYWFGLIDGGGEPSMCGWLKDRYGISWQIVPSRLLELQADPDSGRAARASQAMLKQTRIIISELEAAADAA